MNRFFNNALKKADSLLGRKSRMLLLLTRLGVKINAIGWKETQLLAKDRFVVMGRMTRAYVRGQYRAVPWKTMLLVVGVIIYFVDPVDFIPDLIPVTGLTDDFGLLLWVINRIGGDIDKFIAWEKNYTLVE